MSETAQASRMKIGAASTPPWYAARREAARTMVTGSVRCGKFEEKLTSATATQATPTAPEATVAQATGRHRADGRRPSGKRSSASSSGDQIAASAIVKIHPTHGAPGSEAAPVRPA